MVVMAAMVRRESLVSGDQTVIPDRKAQWARRGRAASAASRARKAT
jgi:hypothetical protein